MALQKAPLAYHSYAPVAAYVKPAIETSFPTTITAYKQPVYAPIAYPAPLAYKHPFAAKVIETHPHVVTTHHTYVPPVPIGRAIVTSYFNVPGGGRRSTFPSFGASGGPGTGTDAGTQGPAQDPLTFVSARDQLQSGDEMRRREPVWTWEKPAQSDRSPTNGGLAGYQSNYAFPARVVAWPASYQTPRQSYKLQYPKDKARVSGYEDRAWSQWSNAGKDDKSKDGASSLLAGQGDTRSDKK